MCLCSSQLWLCWSASVAIRHVMWTVMEMAASNCFVWLDWLALCVVCIAIFYSCCLPFCLLLVGVYLWITPCPLVCMSHCNCCLVLLLNKHLPWMGTEVSLNICFHVGILNWCDRKVIAQFERFPIYNFCIFNCRLSIYLSTCNCGSKWKSNQMAQTFWP